MKRGFTLIELLIVVAIIAILAAIAVPNFLEAQTRSKVARVHADMRSLATAIEEYQTDYNAPPLPSSKLGNPGDEMLAYTQLTTPVAYITSIPRDPFTVLGSIGKGKSHDVRLTFKYMHAMGNSTGAVLVRNKGYAWFLGSLGPSRRLTPESDPTASSTSPRAIVAGLSSDLYCYDSTNGTSSFGSIIRTNKGVYTGDDWEPAP